MTKTYTPKSSIKKCPKPQFKSQKTLPNKPNPTCSKNNPNTPTTENHSYQTSKYHKTLKHKQRKNS